MADGNGDLILQTINPERRGVRINGTRYELRVPHELTMAEMTRVDGVFLRLGRVANGHAAPDEERAFFAEMVDVLEMIVVDVPRHVLEAVLPAHRILVLSAFFGLPLETGAANPPEKRERKRAAKKRPSRSRSARS